MVFVAKTIVYEYTVMIKLLYASITEVTMFSIFWAQVFTVHTHIV